MHVSSPTLVSRLLLRRGAGDLLHQQDFAHQITFSASFCFHFVSSQWASLGEGPRAGTGIAPEKLLCPSLQGWDHPGAPPFGHCGPWCQLIMANEVWRGDMRGLGCPWLSNMVWPPWAFPRRSLENCCFYARVHARQQQQWVQAYLQGLSLEKIARADERRTGKGISSALFEITFSFLARKAIENTFWRPSYPEKFELILLSDLKHRREKGWLVSVRQIWALWVMLITIPLMHLIWTIMLNLMLTFPTVLWKQTKVSSGQGYIILHVLWLLSKGQRTA